MAAGSPAFLFLLPLLFVFGAFSWYPIVRTAIMAFQHTNLVEAPTWVGFQNFAAVWHDPQFPIAVRNTAYFALLALIFGYPIPLIAAVLMSEVRKRRGLYSVLAFLPVVIPPVVGVLLWKTFYDASSLGVFNTILHWVGLGPYPWLQSEQWAMPSLVLYSTWANAGATIIIYLAALIGVNPELYEAASVDGAGLLRKVWHITLPQIRGVLLVTLILQIIGTAQVFLEPYLFTYRRAGQRDADGDAPDLQLRVRELARRQLRHGHGAQPHARRLPGRLLARLPARDPVLEHAMSKPGSGGGLISELRVAEAGHPLGDAHAAGCSCS